MEEIIKLLDLLEDTHKRLYEFCKEHIKDSEAVDQLDNNYFGEISMFEYMAAKEVKKWEEQQK